MKRLLKGTMIALIGMLGGSVAHAGESAIQTYWRQFQVQDPVGSVWDELDARAGQLARVEINGSLIDFQWDADTSSVILVVDNEVITDLIMSVDAQDRPVFHADWLSESVASINGYIDIDEESRLVIHWDQIGEASTRFAITSTGGVGSAEKCVCGGTKGTVYKDCQKEDCDAAGTGCRRDGPVGAADSGYCEWKRAVVVQPTEPGNSTVITNP